MNTEKLPDFKNKTVLFQMTNLEFDNTIQNPSFEMQHGRLFLVGKIVEGSSQNDWLSGLTASVAWDHVQGYVIFDSPEDYISRLSLAWRDKNLQ